MSAHDPGEVTPHAEEFVLDRRALLCAAPLLVTTITSLVGTLFSPYFLARWPLVLILLSPLFRHLVAVAPSVGAVALYAVAVPRHFFPDPFVYLLGRRYGPRAVDWVESNSPRAGRFVRTLERVFGKVGPVALLVSPDVLMSTLAGAAGVRFPVFVVFNVVGTFLTVLVARWFGALFEAQIHTMVAFFRAHLVVATLASIVIVLATNALSHRGAGRKVPAERD